MTAPESRTHRRAAERAKEELARKAASCKIEAPAAADPSATEFIAHRAEVNRANAQHSTGPRTYEGKSKSSRNSFKHGLYSTQLVLTNEDPAKLEALRFDLRAEHQPANGTEEILVNELAENFWRLRRMRAFEAQALQPENVHAWMTHGLIALVHRTMASAERSFGKALSTLRQLQKDRGFVPAIAQSQPSTEPPVGFVPAKKPHQLHAGGTFVPQSPASHGFVSQNREPGFPLDWSDDKETLHLKSEAS